MLKLLGLLTLIAVIFILGANAVSKRYESKEEKRTRDEILQDGMRVLAKRIKNLERINIARSKRS
ncbi:MAG: hypothetical protein MI717_09055 [Spirochaetales bacterium]|nr:hypothetical protein [Spirochaetales bacterium]